MPAIDYEMKYVIEIRCNGFFDADAEVCFFQNETEMVQYIDVTAESLLKSGYIDIATREAMISELKENGKVSFDDYFDCVHATKVYVGSVRVTAQ